MASSFSPSSIVSASVYGRVVALADRPGAFPVEIGDGDDPDLGLSRDAFELNRSDTAPDDANTS